MVSKRLLYLAFEEHLSKKTTFVSDKLGKFVQAVAPGGALLHDVVVEGSGNHHEWFVNKVDDAVLNRDVALYDAGHNHPASVETIPDHSIRPAEESRLNV